MKRKKLSKVIALLLTFVMVLSVSAVTMFAGATVVPSTGADYELTSSVSIAATGKANGWDAGTVSALPTVKMTIKYAEGTTACYGNMTTEELNKDLKNYVSLLNTDTNKKYEDVTFINSISTKDSLTFEAVLSKLGTLADGNYELIYSDVLTSVEKDGESQDTPGDQINLHFYLKNPTPTPTPTPTPKEKTYKVKKASDGHYYLYNGDTRVYETGVYEGPNGWYYVKDGKVDFTKNSIERNSYGWWKITNGKVNFKATGVYKNQYGWWYVKNGKVQFNYTGIRKNSYGWWRIENGKVNFKANGVYQNEYGWWYVQKGKVNFKYYGLAKNQYGWWRIEKGKVNFKATGLYKHNGSTWYVKNGKVRFDFTGTYKGYKVVNGKVTGKA